MAADADELLVRDAGRYVELHIEQGPVLESRDLQLGVVSAVGELVVEPGAANVVPGRVTLSIDLLEPRRVLGCAPLLMSGAGHDAVVLPELTGVAMLFVRSPGGISHHPDESVRPGDVAVSLDVLEELVQVLALA